MAIIFPKKINAVDSWKMQSRANPYQWYKVELLNDGKFVCDCPAVKKCHHIKKIELMKFRKDNYSW